jgi:hypothetical protein
MVNIRAILPDGTSAEAVSKYVRESQAPARRREPGRLTAAGLVDARPAARDRGAADRRAPHLGEAGARLVGIDDRSDVQRGPGQPGGAFGASAGRVRRQHGHAGDASRRDLLSRRKRARRGLRLLPADRVPALVRRVAGNAGMSELDAYQFVSQAVETPLANVVDTNYTSVARLRKDWLQAQPGTTR